jgi:hypothetical protein
MEIGMESVRLSRGTLGARWRGFLRGLAVSLAAVLFLSRQIAMAGAPCGEGFKSSKVKVMPGIVLYKHKCASPLYRAFVLEVKLTTPSYSYFVTPYSERRLTTSEFAERHGALVAVNGGFWCGDRGGFTVSDGQQWPKYGDTAEGTVTGFGGWDKAKQKMRIEIRPPEEVLTKAPDWMKNALTGVPLVLDGGKVLDSDDEVFGARHPRTGLGLSKDGKKLFFVVVDGRRKGWSWGMRTEQLGELFKSIGADRAVNLDGGGSTTMVIASLGGVVNRPCARKGPERNVPNHIAILDAASSGASAAFEKFLAFLLEGRPVS